MFCSQCGASPDDNARFCWSCGAKLDSHARKELAANPTADEAPQREPDLPQAPHSTLEPKPEPTPEPESEPALTTPATASNPVLERTSTPAEAPKTTETATSLPNPETPTLQSSESVTESSATPAGSAQRITIGTDGSIHVGNVPLPRTACVPKQNKANPSSTSSANTPRNVPSLDSPEAWCLPAFFRRPITQIRDALVRRSCRLRAATTSDDLAILLTGGDFCIPGAHDVKDPSFGGSIFVKAGSHTLPSNSLIPLENLPADAFPSKATAYITSEKEADPIACIGSLLDYVQLGSIHRIASDDQRLIDQAKTRFASRLQANGVQEARWEASTDALVPTGLTVNGTTSDGEEYWVKCVKCGGKYELSVTFVYSDANP